MRCSRARALAPLPQDFLRTALCAPVTLARWIAQEQPHLLSAGHLHVVVAGAARGLDSLDRGRWYQFLPDLLGVPDMTVEITLVGPELGAGTTHPSLRMGSSAGGILSSAAAANAAHLAPATVVAEPLAAWWRGRDGASPAPQACFGFHPAMEAFAGSWLSHQEGFLGLLEAGVPLGFASTCVEELWHDDWLVRQHGCALRGPAQANPFALEREDPKRAGQWAALTWTLDRHVRPPAGFAAKKAELVRFHLALEQAKPAFSVVGNAVFGYIGGVVQVKNERTDAVARLVGMPAGVLVSLETGEMLAQNASGKFEAVSRLLPVEPRLLSDFPGEDAHPVDRFIWACEKFRGYFEPLLLTDAKDAPQEYQDLLDTPQPVAIELPSS
ncbi:hypothetical protein D3C71_25660 [compost metagenome]